MVLLSRTPATVSAGSVNEDFPHCRTVLALPSCYRPPSKRSTSSPTIVVTLSDEDVERLLAERRQARASRDFARADQIRQELANGGIIVEDTRDGVRWKRK